MRLPYIDDNPTFDSPSEQAIVERVKERRGGNLIALDKALLHAPPVADGWNAFLGAIRTGTTLSDSLRETAICRIAVLNNAWYEWEQHCPILEASEGSTPEAVEYLRRRPRQNASRAEAEAVLDRRHVLVVEYTDFITKGGLATDALFAELRQEFSDREIVEITATISAYNCVSRFLTALDVGEMKYKYVCWQMCTSVDYRFIRHATLQAAHFPFPIMLDIVCCRPFYKARPARTRAPSPTTAPGIVKPVGAAAPVYDAVDADDVDDAGLSDLLRVLDDAVPEDAALLLLRVPELTGLTDDATAALLVVAHAVVAYV